jgi:hypothetical protein
MFLPASGFFEFERELDVTLVLGNCNVVHSTQLLCQYAVSVLMAAEHQGTALGQTTSNVKYSYFHQVRTLRQFKELVRVMRSRMRSSPSSGDHVCVHTCSGSDTSAHSDSSCPSCEQHLLSEQSGQQLATYSGVVTDDCGPLLSLREIKLLGDSAPTPHGRGAS